MNLKEFAYGILDMQEELNQLRSRNAYLEEELEKYREDVNRSIRQHEETFGKILTAALDPDSHINKQFNSKQGA